MKRTAHGFTLVELLVVIAIIAILAAVVVLIINPLEMTRRSRDAARLSDLANLQGAINVAAQENSATPFFLCGGVDPAPNPTCTGTSTDANARNNNGTGWVKVNLSTQAVKVPTLPVDPTNVAPQVYSYASDGTDWEIDAVLESVQQIPKMTTDGGSADGVYEVGSKLTII